MSKLNSNLCPAIAIQNISETYLARGDIFDPFTYEWADAGYVLSHNGSKELLYFFSLNGNE